MSAPTTAASNTPSTVSSSGPKVSKFATKSGFVIPRNKLSGSLVPVFRGGKKPGNKNDAANEELTNENNNNNSNKVQRKTKWGPDLTQDGAVRRGRALAYQTRVDQITELLKSRILEVEDNNHDSELADHGSSNHQFDSEKLKLLEFEKREVIGELLKLNPSYKAPPDYKPLLKEALVPIPVKEYQGYNFLGLIFGPASDTQKRLEKDTGTTIRVQGTKSDTGEKVEVSPSDGNVEGAYEDLCIHISADTYEKVDAAADLIEMLVTSVSGNLAAISKSASASGENINVLSQSQDEGTVAQTAIGSIQTPPQGQFQFQNPWFQSGPPQTAVHSLNSSGAFLNSPVSVQLSPHSSLNMPSPFGPRPPTAAGFSSFPQNSSHFPPSSQHPMQILPHQHLSQSHPFGHTGPPRNFPMPSSQPSFAQPNFPGPPPFSGSQPQPTGPFPIGRPFQAVSNMPPRPLPDRPLTPAGSSSGWSGAPSSAPVSLGLSNMGQVAHQRPWPVAPQPGVGSTAPPAPFPSGPSNTGMNNPAGLMFASGPPPQMGSSPAFPGSAHTPVPSISPTDSRSNFSAVNSPNAAGPRPQQPSSGDFTFQPHWPQNPASLTVPGPNNQPAMNTQAPRSMSQLPGPPPFRSPGPNAASQPGMQVFPMPQMGQPQAHISAGPFARNPNAAFANASPVSSTTPVLQMGPRNFGPGPQVPNFPHRPGNPLQLQQNYHAPTNRPENNMVLNQQFSNSRSGGQQIYDPFSPTASIPPQQQGANTPRARKQENDPEYEDLMASVGVK